MFQRDCTIFLSEPLYRTVGSGIRVYMGRETPLYRRDRDH